MSQARCVLVAALPTGERVPAVQSIFPAHEDNWQASTFPDAESAARFANVLRALGIVTTLEVEAIIMDGSEI